jgi:hypothetical protein
MRACYSTLPEMFMRYVLPAPYPVNIVVLEQEIVPFWGDWSCECLHVHTWQEIVALCSITQSWPLQQGKANLVEVAKVRNECAFCWILRETCHRPSLHATVRKGFFVSEQIDSSKFQL